MPHFRCIGRIMLALGAITFGFNGYAAIVINKPARPAENMPVQAAASEGESEGTEQDSSLSQAFKAYKQENYNYAYNIFSHYADRNEPHAMMAAGYLLFMGYGTSPDYLKAKRYLERAKDLGFVRAITLQGLLEHRINPQPSNQSALRLLLKAANLGDYVAANALANLYYRRGNITDAVIWNEKAITLGSYAAKRNQKTLSTPNKTQQIVGVDSNSEYVQQLRKESQAGNGQASYELATRYHKGIGVAQNFGEALRLYRIAVQQGSEQARKVLPIILSKQNASGTSLNSLWMQETTGLIPTPPMILSTPNSNTDKVSALPSGGLAEDDPLENLLLLEPNGSLKTNK